MSSNFEVALSQRFAAMRCLDAAEESEELVDKWFDLKADVLMNVVSTGLTQMDTPSMKTRLAADPEAMSRRQAQMEEMLAECTVDSPPSLQKTKVFRDMGNGMAHMFVAVPDEGSVVLVERARMHMIANIRSLPTSRFFEESLDLKHAWTMAMFMAVNCNAGYGLAWEKLPGSYDDRTLKLSEMFEPADFVRYAEIYDPEGAFGPQIVQMDIPVHGSSRLFVNAITKCALLGDLDTAETLYSHNMRIYETSGTSEYHSAIDFLLGNALELWFMGHSDLVHEFCTHEMRADELNWTGDDPTVAGGVAHFFTERTSDFHGMLQGSGMLAWLMAGKCALILAGRCTVPDKDIIIQAPDVNFGPYISEYTKAVTDMSLACVNAFAFRATSVAPNAAAAECLLKLGRYDEALAHCAFYEQHCWDTISLPYAPWLQGRILAAQAKASGSRDFGEIISLLEKGAAEATKFDAPLLVALILQDLLALVPGAALPDRADLESRREEVLFDLTMERPSPMKSHLESGKAFDERD